MKISNYFAFTCLLTSLTLQADTSQFYEDALVAYNNEQYQEAYIHLKNSLKDDPNNLAAKILMGKLLLRNTYLEEAEVELLEALEMGGDINLILEPLGNALTLQRKYQEILDLEYTGRATPETQFRWLLYTATANFKLERIDHARRDYYEAADIFPADLRAVNALVSMELAQGRVEEAKELIDRAMGIDDQNGRLWQLLGKYYRVTNEFGQAETALAKADRLQPNDPLILRSLADIYVQNKEREKAQTLIARILEQTPDDPMALLLNSWLLSEKNNVEQAADELSRISETLANFDADTLGTEPILLYISAISSYAQGRYEQARENFEQYLISEPQNLQASTMLARTYLKLNNPKLALETLEPFSRKIVDSLDNAIFLGELYLKNNKTFKAVGLLSRLSSTYPDNRKVLLLNVKTLGARGKLEEAVKMIDESGLQNSDIQFVLTKSMLLLQMGKTKEASYVADRLLDIDGENLEFVNLKGAVLIKLKEWTEAEPYIDRVLAQQPDNYSAKFNKATILAATQNLLAANTMFAELKERNSDNVPTLLSLAKTQQATNQFEAAIENLNRVLELDFKNLQASEMLVSLYARTGDYDKAIRTVSRLIKDDPDNPGYLFQKATLYANQNELENANRQFAIIERTIGDDAKLLQELSNLRFRVGDKQGAKRNIQQAAALAPDDLSIGLSYAVVHIAVEELAKAEAKLTDLLDTHKKVPMLIVTQGDLYSAREQYQQAAEAYYRALKFSPKFRLALNKLYQLTLDGHGISTFEDGVGAMVRRYPQDHYRRNLYADFLLNQQKTDAALEEYQKLAAVEDFPNRLFVLNNLANIYLERDLAVAEQYINQALELKRDNAAILDTLGWIQAKKGQLEDALLTLRQAYAMNSKDPGIRYHLGYTLHKLGRIEEAKLELSAAVTSERVFVDKDDAQALLESI